METEDGGAQGRHPGDAQPMESLLLPCPCGSSNSHRARESLPPSLSFSYTHTHHHTRLCHSRPSCPSPGGQRDSEEDPQLQPRACTSHHTRRLPPCPRSGPPTLTRPGWGPPAGLSKASPPAGLPRGEGSPEDAARLRGGEDCRKDTAEGPTPHLYFLTWQPLGLLRRGRGTGAPRNNTHLLPGKGGLGATRPHLFSRGGRSVRGSGSGMRVHNFRQVIRPL